MCCLAPGPRGERYLGGSAKEEGWLREPTEASPSAWARLREARTAPSLPTYAVMLSLSPPGVVPLDLSFPPLAFWT